MGLSAGGLRRRPVRAATRPHTTRLVALVATVVGLALLALAVAVTQSLRNSRAQALDAAEHSARGLVLAVTGAVARTVQSVDVLLQSAAAQLDEAGWQQPSAVLDDQLRQMLRFTPHIRQLAVVAADGRVLADSGDRKTTARLDVAALFAEAQAAPRPLVVVASRPGRLLGDTAGPHRHLPILYPHHRRDGGGGVLLVAALNPLYFNEMFESLELPASARVGLWRYDGTLLTGLGDDEDYRVQAHAGDPLFAERLPQGEFGVFTDANQRITAFRTALNWPLVVSVGLSREEVLAQWRDGAWPLLWPLAALGLALLAAVAVLARTLAQRASAEAMLVLSERVLDTVSNGVAISDATDPDLPLVYVNPAFEAMTGYAAEQVLGRNPRFLHGDDRDQPGLEQVRQALASGGAVEVELRNYRADGTPYWNELTISAVHAVSGRLTHFVAIQRDVTERRNSRAQLAKAYERIERYSAELERFSVILAHHLQEPARHIAVYSQLVARALADSADPETRTNLDYLSRAAMRLKGLLRDVQLYLAVDRLVMVGGSASAEAVLDREWEARTRDLPDADLRSGALPRLQVPARRLADLFGILIDNAVTFRRPDQPLRLTVEAAEQGDGFWRLRFTDNGLGVPPEFLDRIFGVFERLHGREHFPGNGVGLAIARKLVETLGGRIHAQSDGVTGTTIVLTLPAATE